MSKVEYNKIYNKDCLELMSEMDKDSIDIIITSPPYNTTREDKSDPYAKRYDFITDNLTDEEYLEWTVKLFKGFDKILKKDRCVVYNMSYSTQKPYLMYVVINEIMKNTNFKIADTLYWKKKNDIPENMTKNRLTRIVENIFIFVRESELKTFITNKKVINYYKTGQSIYKPIFNYIEARNNDGTNELNKATFSTELISNILDIYVPNNDYVIYDPFMGIGTTANACMLKGYKYIGSEISEAQVDYANKKLSKYYSEGEGLF